MGQSGPIEKMITTKQASNTDQVRSSNPPAAAHQIVASIGGNAHRSERSPDHESPAHDAAGTGWSAYPGGPALTKRCELRIPLAIRFRADNPIRWSALAHPTLFAFPEKRRVGQSGPVEKMITVKKTSKTDHVRSCNRQAPAHQDAASIGANAHRSKRSPDHDIPPHDAAGTGWNADPGGPALAERRAIRIALASGFGAENPSGWSALAHPTVLPAQATSVMRERLVSHRM